MMIQTQSANNLYSLSDVSTFKLILMTVKHICQNCILCLIDCWLMQILKTSYVLNAQFLQGLDWKQCTSESVLLYRKTNI